MMPLPLVRLLAIGLLFGGLGCSTTPDVVRAQLNVDVAAYEADLTLDPDTRRLEGVVRAEVHHPDTATALRFYLTGMSVDTIRAENEIVDYSRRDDVLIIPIQTGREQSAISITYHGIPAQGLYRRGHDGQQVIFTDSWPTRARGWLPSVDMPSDPATFRLTLRVPVGYETVANGRRVARDTVDRHVQTTWKLSASAPTYSLAFAVSDFAPTCITGGDALPICYYMLAPDSSRAVELERSPQTLKFLSEQLGPYAYDNYQVVQIPIQYGGMENAALPFLRAELFHADDRAESVQVHEAVHQWFGNRVVIERWRDLWLSEGVATYYTTLFYEHYDGDREARRRWVEMVDVASEQLAGGTVLVPDRAVNPGQFLTWIPYQKGASVLHLFRTIMGEEQFRAAMRDVYSQYGGRPLSTPVFLDVLTDHTDVSLEAIIDYWVYGGEVPTLAVQWTPESGEVTWEIRGDEGTLEGVPFELQIMDGDTPVYVPVSEQAYRLTNTNSNSAPTVRPVGILMRVNVTR